MKKKEYQYTLGKVRIECPQCRRRTFKPYIDTANGEVLDASVGRCNRQFSCAYHRKPRDYFAEHGEISRPEFRKTERAIERLCPSLIPFERISRFMGRDVRHCPISRLLERYFGPATAQSAATLYLLGYDCRSNSTAYWLMDHNFQCRSGKFMVYNMDGHRNRFLPYAFRWAHSKIKDFRYVACFYGAHTIGKCSNVIMVESEKTALVLACWLISRNMQSRCAVIATGGCSNISFDPARIFDPAYKYYPLRGKRLLLIPDADAVDKWRAAARQLAPFVKSVRLWDIRPYAETASDDIADIILRRLNRQPMSS